MLDFWSKFLTTLALIVAVALLGWAAFGAVPALLWLSVALMFLLLRNLRNLYAFKQWLRHPSLENVPAGSGLWEDTFAALYRLVRQQTQSKSSLFAALERFRQVGAAMPDGMVILDEEDRIEWCNPRAEQHLGVSLSRDVGQQITYLVRHPQFVEYLNGDNYTDPLILKLPRNTELTLAVQLVPYGENQKLLFSRDISRLERAETVRRDFVANVSHELRTPLTVLCGFLETVIDTPQLDAAVMRKTLQRMQEQALRMQHLVEDLLTLSQLENTATPPREDHVDVPALMTALYQEAQALSAGRHAIQMQTETNAWLIGDAQQLRSAFSNLISNAVRYTPEGGSITLRWSACDKNAGYAFTVEDSGIGIEAQHIPRLTERFYRVDRGRSRGTGGTGLGLAIVKHVLNRHDARLEIQSELGRGSCFSAVFPASRAIAAPNAQRSA